MTIIYQYRVATTSLGGFLKLLCAWRGSVYKLLYKELIIFLGLYGTFSVIYRVGLKEQHKRWFEAVVTQLHHVTSAVPMSFVLGFYVSIIVRRWWQQFSNVPWPDRTLFILSTYLRGDDDKARMMRRTVARYMLFAYIIIMRAVSVAVMKRFPTLDHIVEAGFINIDEKIIYESVQCQYLKFWVPLVWANDLLVRAKTEGRIQTDFGLRMVIDQLADYRDKCSLCFVFDWITVPLVYTQVVTFAVHSYFAACLLGHQYLDPSQRIDGFEYDFYVPGFTILQFLFYMGWLKVAEQMINPFGEDDDDYDINWLLDRHTAVAFTLVDHCHGKHPPLTRDQFWNDMSPDVPYTESSRHSIRPNFLGSTFNIASRPSADVDRLMLPDYEMNWLPLRKRSRSATSGSIFSILPFRHLRSHGNAGSRDTLTSNGSAYDRNYPSMPNGKSKYFMAPGNDMTGQLFDWQGRKRSNTEFDERSLEEKERKLSLPFSFSTTTSKNTASGSGSCTKPSVSPASSSPRPLRFHVEAVQEEPREVGDTGTRNRRSGNSIISLFNGDKVSRIPDLSAIEEGNTITSVLQLQLCTNTDASPTTKDTDKEDTSDEDQCNDELCTVKTTPNQANDDNYSIDDTITNNNNNDNNNNAGDKSASPIVEHFSRS